MCFVEVVETSSLVDHYNFLALVVAGLEVALDYNYYLVVAGCTARGMVAVDCTDRVADHSHRTDLVESKHLLVFVVHRWQSQRQRLVVEPRHDNQLGSGQAFDSGSHPVDGQDHLTCGYQLKGPFYGQAVHWKEHQSWACLIVQSFYIADQDHRSTNHKTR
jgi:hypothetical protein